MGNRTAEEGKPTGEKREQRIRAGSLPLPKPRQLHRHDQAPRHERHGDTAQKGQAQRSLVAQHDLLARGALEGGDRLDALADAGDDVGLGGPGDVAVEVDDEGVLHDEAAGGDAEDHAEAAPEDEGARDDGLVALRRHGEHGHEGAGELEALAQGVRHEDGEVAEGRPAALQAGEGEGAEDEKGRAGGEGPLEAARARDEEARDGAGRGGHDRRDHEAEARVGGRQQEDGLEVEGHVEEDGVGEDRGERVGKDEVHARRVPDEMERHDGTRGQRLAVEKGREGDGKGDERRHDERMGPCEFLSVRAAAHGRQVYLQGSTFPPRFCQALEGASD
ncbi:hypothetical protein VDGL01_08154 [Verticillium dahliae]